MSLAPEAIRALVTGEHGDPFWVLGPHPGPDGTVEVRAFLPGARAVPWHGQEQSVVLTLPPLAVLWLRPMER